MRITYQDAIEYFKAYVIFYTENGSRNWLNVIYKLALAVLNKQVPKKISERIELKDFTDITFAIRGKCPMCGFENILMTGMEYCSCCGQRLDWED